MLNTSMAQENDVLDAMGSGHGTSAFGTSSPPNPPPPPPHTLLELYVSITKKLSIPTVVTSTVMASEKCRRPGDIN